MKNVIEFINKFGTLILIVVSVLCLFKSCGNSKKIDKLKKEELQVSAKIDSISNVIISKDEMIYLIKTVPAYETLIEEELVDKKQMSIQDLYKGKANAE